MAPLDRCLKSRDVIARVLAGEIMIRGVKDDPLVTGRVIVDELPISAPSLERTTMARTEFVP